MKQKIDFIRMSILFCCLCALISCGGSGPSPAKDNNQQDNGGNSQDQDPGNNGSSGGSSGGNDNGGSSGGNGTRFHPVGFVAPDQHGIALMQSELVCTSCHGQDLTGSAIGPSCDLCHTPADPQAWRSDCTFCHGGTADESGAPPSYLDGTDVASGGKFPAHQAHVHSSITSGLDCNQCHLKAEDILSPGHIFGDTTAGIAEVDMANGLSPQAVYTTGEGCASSYCHGDGRNDNGVIAQTSGPLTCSGCHSDITSGSQAWSAMSGFHNLHLSSQDQVISCRDCHNSVTDDDVSIANKSLHINDQRNLAFTDAAMNFDVDQQSCNGSCHGKAHPGYGWADTAGGVAFHPSGFAQPEQHGVEFVLQRSDCRSSGCHGPNLLGLDEGAPGLNCNSCHDADENGTADILEGKAEAWRSDCVFCHGGDLNDTGAPPHDLGAVASGYAQSFLGHSAHVQDGPYARAMDCVQCHNKPEDMFSPNHVFDGTPGGQAELDFSAGLSSLANYQNGTCSNSYCHGNGQADEGVVSDGAILSCDSCHADIDSGNNAWVEMSGYHSLHLQEANITCADCHRSVTTDNTSIANLYLHVNKQKDVLFAEAAIGYNPADLTCTGSCHNKNHAFSWGGGGGGNGLSPHPADYILPSQHGRDMELQNLTCNGSGCHGQQLEGSAGPACATCHANQFDEDCAYCHGGTDNNTGAPPRDLGADAGSNQTVFAPHTAHVEASNGFATPLDCDQCHAKPDALLSDGHVFDVTPGEVEIDFTQGLSPASIFDSQEGSCSNSYCHGDGREGRNNGTVTIGETMACGSCHAERPRTGEHFGNHARYQCVECHQAVSLNGTDIVDPALHINKVVNVDFRLDMQFDPRTKDCSGACHGRENWYD